MYIYIYLSIYKGNTSGISMVYPYSPLRTNAEKIFKHYSKPNKVSDLTSRFFIILDMVNAFCNEIQAFIQTKFIL